MNNKVIRNFFIYFLMIGLMPAIAYSQPTEEQILASIELGVPWLVSQQNVNGSWGSSEAIAYTGFALTKLCDYAYEQGLSPFDEEFVYHSNVESGFGYIFGMVKNHGPATGLCATPILNFQHETYNAAIALMAVAASKSPDRIISSANVLVNGLTFKQLQDEMVAYFAWSQIRPGDVNGGWSYYPGYPNDDNSHTGYVTLALTYAESEGSAIPASVKSNLSIWLDYIQNDVSGGSGYMNPTQYVNLIKTGNLLTEFAFVGDELTDARVQAALGYIQTNWNAFNLGILEYGIGDPQTMYCLMKGFESFDIEMISVAGPDDTNWFEVFTTDLIASQNPGGFWPNEASGWDNEILNTCWALFVLEKIVPNKPPVAVCQNVTATADENCEGFATVADFDAGSYDPDEDPVTIVIAPEGPYPLGETEVVLTITDDSGESDECTAIITVVDLTPPVITVADPITMWSPNHKYTSFGLNDLVTGVSDNCSELNISDVKIVKVTSDEPEDMNGNGDGKTLNDMVIADDCMSVQLRGEREGTGNGRVYTVYLELSDYNGNIVSTVCFVNVPHDMNSIAIDDVPVYEVLGDCMEKSGKIANNQPEIQGYKLTNYPNPFNASTTIEFTIPVETSVILKVYNLFGQEVVTLVNQKHIKGTYNVHFDAAKLPAGQYLYRLNTSDFTTTKKMILNR